MALEFYAIPVVADTPTEVAGGTAAGAPVSTQARTTNAKLTFVPDTGTAVVAVATDEATLVAGEGFPVFTDGTSSAESFDLVSADALWVQSDADGVLYVAVS